jgi:hypothetical protein
MGGGPWGAGHGGRAMGGGHMGPPLRAVWLVGADPWVGLLETLPWHQISGIITMSKEDTLMKLYRVLSLVCIAALLAACTIFIGNSTVGSGKVITEKRTVGEFTSLDLSCSANVTLVQGESLAVSIEGEDNIIPLIETKVSTRKLSIDAKPNASFRNTKPLTVNIVVPSLVGVRVTGSGDVEMSKWMIDSLELITSGSGSIRIDSLDTPALTATLSGSGDIRIKGGGGGTQKIKISGSGDFNSASMESREVDATTSGSGNITVWVTKILSAHISGSGDIQYYGSPEVDKKDTGSGSVEKLGGKP